MRYLNYILLLFSLVSCKNDDIIYVEDIDNIEQNEYFKLLFPENDNKDILITLNLFNDSLQITPFDSNIGGELNLEIKFYKLNNKKYNKILTDTVYVDFFNLNWKGGNFNDFYFFDDYNFDGHKDFLIRYDVTNRGNESNHLYLIDSDKSEIDYIDSFKNYYNVKVIKEDSILTSFYVGRVYKFDFLKINNKNVDVIFSKSYDFKKSDNFFENFSKSLDSITQINK